jgi:hypothetical protein
MGGPSKERMWGETIRQAEQRARETRYSAGLKLAIERGWLELDRSGTFTTGWRGDVRVT